MGTLALHRLGFRKYQARRSAQIFQQHDIEVLHNLRPIWNDRKNYVIKARQSREDLEKILENEHGQTNIDEDEAWDTNSLIKEYGDS